MNCNQKGNLANLKFLLRAHEKGVTVSKPINDSCRYDYIVDWNNQLYKVQLKYAGRENVNAEGSISLCLTKKIKGKYIPYSKPEVDILIMYCPFSDKIYWIPPEKFHDKTSISLRFKPCKNNMKANANLAIDFEW